MISQLFDLATQHQAAFTGAAMAAVHFSHLAAPRIAAAFVYCRDNGGAIGIVKQFLRGTGKLPAPINNQPTAPQGEK